MRINRQCIWPILVMSSSTVFAQATENAVTGASDAFGFSNGDESVGIYDEQSVRGFNLEASGNYRINGRYFVKSSGTSNFFLKAKTVHIGYNTFGIDLPGPSGVVDFTLRDPDIEEPSLLTAGLAAYGSPYMDFLYKHRSSDGSVSAAAGIGLEYDMLDHQGGTSNSWLLAGTARWNLSDQTKLQFFGGEYSYRRKSQFKVRTDGSFVPDKINRGSFLGQDWAEEKGERRIAGLLWDHAANSGWNLGGIVVFSQDDPTSAYAQLIQLSAPQGIAQNSLITSPHQKFTAWSGELTAGRRFTTQNFSHKVTLHSRWRVSRNHFGGEDFLDLGSYEFGKVPLAHAETPNTNTTNLSDAVDQWGLGIAYQMVWANHIKVSAGLLRSDYKKSFRSPDAQSQNRTKPWLYNIGVSGKLNNNLEIYGSYSRGLEEAGTAPSSSSNPNTVLNAVIVTQRELGIKAKLSNGLDLIVAGFDTRKPYAGIDSNTNIYGLFGKVKHRGIEASLSGEITEDLSVILGGVVMEAQLDSDAVRNRQTGKKPVGVPKSRFIANLNYTLPSLPELSLDAGIEIVGKQMASSRLIDGQQLELPQQTTVNTGLRYQFSFGNTPATLRFQALNLFNSFFWKVSSAETFDYNAQRRFRLVLTTEF